MNGAIIVQARMTSQRLPGKVLREIAGRPLLAFLIERLERSGFALPVIVATSTDSSDDAIVDFCQQRGVLCRRGSLLNVADRFRRIANELELDAMVRISGDSPLLDMSIVHDCVDRFLESTCDLATNVFPRTFPRGQSAEVVRVSTFQRAYNQMSDPEDFEHVTRFYYRNSSQFRIENVVASADYGTVNMAVDSPQDLLAFEHVVQSMDKPQWEYGLAEVAELYCRVGLVEQPS